MLEEKTIELFYDYINTVAEALLKRTKLSYLEGINEALNYLHDDQFKDTTVDDEAVFKAAKETVIEQPFEKETIRKAIQLALLKGFKLASVTNAQITPDSIGIFMSYLVKKLYQESLPNIVLDPLVGTGNLLTTLANHLEHPFEAHGIDDDPLMCEIARNFLDSMELDNQVFLQNTVTYKAGMYDLIVADFPPRKLDDKLEYLPYLTVIHHLSHLKDGHYFMALIENNFFDQNNHAVFKKELKDKAHLFGLIKLDEGLFKTHPKSILILKKKTAADETLDDFLMVDLPPFRDIESFNTALNKMDNWFKKKEVDVQ